jgi:serine/threonine protein kinase
MQHYNACGVIHRDIKPENIMIGMDGRPRFCDFGVAKKISQNQNMLRTEVGTDLYKAPEIHKHNYNEKCDIWSLAIVIYQMVTGDVPFDIESGVGKLIKDIR